jgi:hypothetical protein
VEENRWDLFPGFVFLVDGFDGLDQFADSIAGSTVTGQQNAGDLLITPSGQFEL